MTSKETETIETFVEVDQQPLLDVVYDMEIEQEVFMHIPGKGFCVVNITRHCALNVKFMDEEIIVEPECYDTCWKIEGQ